MCQEQVERALQQSGKRITQQRKILLDVILNGDWEWENSAEKEELQSLMELKA